MEEDQKKNYKGNGRKDFYQRVWVEKFTFLQAESSGKNKYPYWHKSEVIPWGHLFSGLRIKMHPQICPPLMGVKELEGHFHMGQNS